MRSILLLLIVSISFKTISAQQNEAINELNGIIKPIITIKPSDNYDDIKFLKSAIGNSNIVGIGESTHGTKLYDQYRQRLIRYLVEEMNYKAIIDEGSIISAEKIDNYITNKVDTIGSISYVQPVLLNKVELDWLRNYNKKQPVDQYVHIYGMEVRDFNGIINRLKDFHKFSPSDEAVLEKFTGDVGIGFKNLSKSDFENLKKIEDNLNKTCDDALCKTYIPLLHQQIDFAYRQRFDRNDFNVRDNNMFENAKATIAKVPGNKSIILAHNGHLQKTKFGKSPSLGYKLNNFYKEKYFVIATDFNKGNVIVFDKGSGKFTPKFFGEVVDKSAIEYYFKQLSHSNFIVLMDDALKNQMTKKIVSERTKMLRNMGAMGDIITWPIILADNYDAIVFFNDSSISQ